MKKFFLVLSLAIISALALGACASNNNATGTAVATGVVPGTGATGVVTGTVVPGTTQATGVVSGTTEATGTVLGTPLATGSVVATSGTPAATVVAGTPTPTGNAATVYRLSNILGARVVPSNVAVTKPEDIKDNQTLGTIDSVLVDVQSGNIDYVLLNPGEAVPNAPEGLVAVPFSALTIAPRSATASTAYTNDYHDYFTSKLTAQDIQKAPVVNVDNTDFTTPNFDTAWRSYFTGLSYQVPTVGQNGVLRLNSYGNIFAGTDVVDNAGNDVGNVSNFLLDPQKGVVNYVVVADGGFLGLGENYTPVPWKDLTYQPKPQQFKINVPVDLSQAPAYTSLNDLNALGTNWDQEIVTFWNNPAAPAAPTSAATAVPATPMVTATP